MLNKKIPKMQIGSNIWMNGIPQFITTATDNVKARQNLEMEKSNFLTGSPFSIFDNNSSNLGFNSPQDDNDLQNTNVIDWANQRLRQDYNIQNNQTEIRSKTPPYPSKFKNFMKKNGLGLATSSLDAINGFLPQVENSKAFDTINSGLSTAAGIAGSINPLAGVAVKGVQTTLNAINSLGAQKADSFTKNKRVYAQLGNSYTGSESLADEALTNANTEFGTFNAHGRRKANRVNAEARLQQGEASMISDDASKLFALRDSMSAINGNRRAYDLNSGYQQAFHSVGKNGMKIQLNRAREIISKSKKLQNNIEEKKVESHKEGGLINPTLNNTEIKLVTPELINDVSEFKDGGELNNYSEIELITPDSIVDEIEEFKDGGEINIIPEGALHARKHNMETEGITKKGIPVVAEKEGGELEQQAEIEREEIIFRLEVTKKLESLEKKYYSEETSQKEKDELALEAGRLLTEEILHNTQDNTNNLL